MPSLLPNSLKLGLPVWAHGPWAGNFFTTDAKRSDYLAQYGSVFNTVEGNASFYGLPKPATVQRWCEEAPDGFHFCFKFPRVVSHDLLLKNAGYETDQFLERVKPLGLKLGSFFIQLPPHFGPRQLSNLPPFLKSLPPEFQYAVEVRHTAFFNGSVEESDLNQMLTELAVDRVVFDTRALHTGGAVDEETENALRRKPNLPVKPVATSQHPFIRFVGHPNLQETGKFLQEWVEPVLQWLDQGKQPYFFTHMPDDLHAPELGRNFLDRLIAGGLNAEPMVWPAELETPPAIQMDLFNS